ncbi:cytidylyltransferase domain-containing protein [Roseivirga echinicomitans]|uniref:cytidylyltransferase domain-containing protein n=1 Tax=Roseivirga echinicomitans TaxID=296218 RepID=UPI000A8B6D94|nr:glycosyltransferase family protein [Roseivirga echinicomitans]
MNVIIVTQARIGSSRLPRKILKRINDQSLLEIHLSRLKKSKLATKIIVATTFESGIEEVIDIGKKMAVDVFQGATDDVLDRFYQSVKDFTPDYIVRVTSDCPLIDPELVDKVIEIVKAENLDYASNGLEELYPDGQDVEVFSFNALKKAWEEAKLPSDREHVTPYIRKNTDFMGGELFKAQNLACEKNYNQIRMTVDESADFEAMETLINELGVNEPWQTYTQYIIRHSDKFKNQSIYRNEGYLKSLQKDNL